MVRPREFQDEAIFYGVYRALSKKDTDKRINRHHT